MSSGPVWSDDPTPRKRRLRLLVLGPPKIGKSVTVLGTCPQPAYTVNCDQDSALDHVTTIYPKARFAQEKLPVHTMDQMERGLHNAKRLVKEGIIKTVVLDTLSGFSAHLLKECEELNPDGRKYYPAYTNYIINLCSRICAIPAHVIVTSHYIDATAEESAEVGKVGPGVVPLLATKGARMRVGAEFDDVVFMENRKGHGRVFMTDIEGMWGPGGRNIHGAKVNGIKANIRTLMREMGMLPPKNAKIVEEEASE
jgi:hypothetical protein